MKSVPFYANTPDDTHCFQASMRMILKYFMPEREFSWEELEELSAKVEGLATWPQKMLINLAQMGFDVTLVEGFDGKAFIRQGGTYLARAFGGETAKWQIANSDIPQEQRLYEALLAQKGAHVENRLPSLREVKEYLDRGYLVNCAVNSRKLNGKPGYVGHFVVIYKMSPDIIELHDPGLPAQKNRQVSTARFEAAWADPNETAKNFIAIKLKEPTHV